MTNAVAERAEDIRDLRSQVSELRNTPEEQEVVFKETSPKRVLVTVWSMLDGEAIRIPRHSLEGTLDRALPDGSPMFTARQERAPAFIQGQIKCFMHKDSAEHASLVALGITKTCPADQLANLHSKRMHALHRHSQEWASFAESIAEEREQQNNDRQERQLEAMMALAGKAAGVAETFICDECGFESKSAAGLAAHQRAHPGN